MAELMVTWSPDDAMDFTAVMSDNIVPHYRLLIESYNKAQNVQKSGRETELDRLAAVPK